MACRLVGAKPLFEPMLTYRVDPQEQTSVKFESKCKTFLHENAFEEVACEITAILSRPQYVRYGCWSYLVKSQELNLCANRHHQSGAKIYSVLNTDSPEGLALLLRLKSSVWPLLVLICWFPIFWLKRVQIIWRFHLRVPHLHRSCEDRTTCQGIRMPRPKMAARRHPLDQLRIYL